MTAPHRTSDPGRGVGRAELESWGSMRARRAIGWTPVPLGHPRVVAFERAALGTGARVVIWPAATVATALDVVDRQLADLDRQVSRFRPDSELRTAELNPGAPTLLTQGAADALTMALAAAVVTGGLVDPTVGRSLCALGYDRDFAAIADGQAAPSAPRPAPGWQSVRLEGRALRLPAGVQLDLGATAKGLGADRAAHAVAATSGRGGVLVELGGDVAVAGAAPADGWPLHVTEDPLTGQAGSPVVRLRSGGVATSSVCHRRWHQAGRARHHIVDPSTGLPVDGPWRTATVVARTCVEANVASTAALVAGEDAVAWLERFGLPARLVSRSHEVRLVAGWPAESDALVRPPDRSIFDRSSRGLTG